MARENDDRLKRVLRDWLDRTGEPDDREALVERISRAVDEVTPKRHRQPESSWRRNRASRAVMAVATVAAILLVTVLWQIKHLPAPAPSPRGNDPVVDILAQLDADELERRLALLDQLDELFEDRWQWMVECGDRLDMRVAAKSQAVSSSELVAARLAVLVRDDPAKPFRMQEKTFVLTREQQAVEAVLEDGVSRRLFFWAFPIDDGLFTYDVDLQTQEPQELSISSSGVVAAGRPTKILSFQQAGSEYRVYLLLVPGNRMMPSRETRHL